MSATQLSSAAGPFGSVHSSSSAGILFVLARKVRNRDDSDHYPSHSFARWRRRLLRVQPIWQSGRRRRSGLGTDNSCSAVALGRRAYRPLIFYLVNTAGTLSAACAPNLGRRFVVAASGDLQAFMPLLESSKSHFMLASPSITSSDRQYTQKVFGVSGTQAAASGYREYAAHSGLTAAGLGFGATYFIMRGWLINADVAANRLFGNASDSPITQASFQRIAELTPAYQW